MGVSLETARANNWVLKSTSGAEIPTNAGRMLADVGSAGYRAAWCTNVLADLQAWGYEGFMNDDCTGWAAAGPSSIVPALYPNESAWQAAMLGMASTVYSYFNSRGYLACHNAGWYSTTNTAGNNNASNKKTWWSSMAPYADYLMDEGFAYAEEDSALHDPDKLRRVGSEWYNNWDAYQGLVDHAYSIGVQPFCLSKGRTTPNPTRRLTYAFASFLLDWEPTLGGVFGWCATEYTGTGQWPTQYSTWLPMGTPTGVKTKTGNAWSRTYTNGVVTVDPVAGTASIT
jgi:hypothetical protein